MTEPDPTVRSVTAEIPPIHSLSVEQARQGYEQYLAFDGNIASVGAVQDRTAPGPAGEIPVRVYEPDSGRVGDPPLVVWMHGGGFVLGDVDSYDPTCRVLCDELDAVVVSVDYRRAPEHHFPAAVEDCFAATEWAADNASALGANPDRVVVAGDSAGGNLAAAVALLARDTGGPGIHHQVLLSPTTTFQFEFDTNGEPDPAFFITEADLAWSWGHYLATDIHGMNPYASPLQARSLADLPPATVLTCEFDPLREEGLAYVDRLEGAGVDVTHTHYEVMIHAFFTLLAEPRVDRAWDAVDFIREDLSSRHTNE